MNGHDTFPGVDAPAGSKTGSGRAPAVVNM